MHSIWMTGDQLWEDALLCIRSAVIAYRKEHASQHKPVEYRALQLLQTST